MIEDTGVQVFRGKKSERLVTVRQTHRKFYKTVDRPVPMNHPFARWWETGEPPTRDSKKRKCYKAEDDVRKQITQRRFGELDDMALYVRDVLEADWFQLRWPYFKEIIVVQKGHGVCRGGPRKSFTDDGVSHVSLGRIQISTWGMGLTCKSSWIPGGEMIVLHEIAHACTTWGESHGRLWARTFVELVRHQMGEHVAELLKTSFSAYRVPIIPFRLVDDKTKEIKIQLAACREERKAVQRRHGKAQRPTKRQPQRLPAPEEGSHQGAEPGHIYRMRLVPGRPQV